MKIIAALLAGAVSALAFLVLTVVLFFPAMSTDRGWEVGLHFAVFGAVIIFPLALFAVIPYFIFRKFGWPNRRSILVGSVALALAYPGWVWLTSPGFVHWWAFVACAFAGALAATVFCHIAGVGRDAASGL